MNKAFLKLDSDSSGGVTYEEFNNFLNDPNMKRYLKQMDFDPKRIDGHSLFALMDQNENGQINSDELIAGFMSLHGYARRLDLAALTYDSNVRDKRHQAHAELVEKALGPHFRNLRSST
eukprot:gnl/TRDRNA2_/TRDRNA2_175522_c1_seq30.p1 gnl/TRDRNA2_/TRDRNA2_175522_c1~~gnl/TRDRNA2_/TRDRNA2_175522_c1_seq30.p1  ORF type:complete len:119 (-),score=16.47 gnl/TRDRNA2_/TRDRNA2_175522_c1_seq30:327-683(-)